MILLLLPSLPLCLSFLPLCFHLLLHTDDSMPDALCTQVLQGYPSDIHLNPMNTYQPYTNDTQYLR